MFPNYFAQVGLGVRTEQWMKRVTCLECACASFTTDPVVTLNFNKLFRLKMS